MNAGKGTFMLIKDVEIRIVCGDITAVKAEALVNAANNRMLMGGGVAGDIKRAGGEEIEKEAVCRGPVEIGESVATSAGRLTAKYVIHAATMGMDFRTDEQKIRAACRSALGLAAGLGISSVVFPALGCGTGGFSYKAAAKIMAQEVHRLLSGGKAGGLKEIIFCLKDKGAAAVFEKNVCGYLEYMTRILKQPFLTVDAIIETEGGIVIIKRSNPPFGWALPGGFVDYGESLEDAVKREAREETGLEMSDLRQFHTYSDPERDPRFHTVGTVFIGRSAGTPAAGDDAAEVRVVSRQVLAAMEFAFDHKRIIGDYLKEKGKEL